MKLEAPWACYSRLIGESLAKWCLMCDAEPSTLSQMQKGFPSLFRRLPFAESHCKDSIESELQELFATLETMLPEEHQECMVYALMLIERGFAHGIFLHSSTVVR